MRIKFLLLLLAFLFLPSMAHSKVADLKPEDIHNKVNEFLYNHISQKRLTSDIMERAINNFVELLDPQKLYFTQEEVNLWLNPSKEQLDQTLKAFYKSDFALFESIYQKMILCIDRREGFEREIGQKKLLENVSAKELNLKEWNKDAKELKDFLHKMRSIQAKFSQKLDKDFKDKFFVLIEKRRKWREQEIIGSSKEEQGPILYTYILKAIASALDSQTDYFSPDEANMMMQQVQQRLLGVGVRLIDDLTGFKIVDIIEGGPAKNQGGLEVNDKIIAVDHEPVVGMDIYQAVQMIQGKENTLVTLTVMREEANSNEQAKTLDVTIKRGGIVIEESRLQAFVEPYADGVIGHLILHSFYQDPSSSSSEDLYNKICDLKNNYNLKGIILDLRNNTGGLLIQGVAISSFFVGKGIVATTKQYDGSIYHFRNEQPDLVWDGPLVVLMNKASASSAEIVAQSLQDYGRAIIVGDCCSFGKGTYQITSILPNISQVNPKGEHKITQGMYYTVSGKTPQLTGVISDVIVPGYLSETEYGEKFSKYPVPNNSIESGYDDKLADISPWQRSYYRKNYLNNLQTKMNTFTKHIPTLKANAEKRIFQNKDYQHFLKSLKEEDSSEEASLASNDLQLLETYNIMKDLIYFYEKEQEVPKAAS